MSQERIVRRTLGDVRDDQTDWARLAAMTEEEIEANALSDPDAQPLSDDDLAEAALILPGPKPRVCLPIDRDVLDWFRLQGRGFQARINAVLRDYMESQERKAAWAKAKAKDRS